MTTDAQCPVCGSASAVAAKNGPADIECVRCGHFTLYRALLELLPRDFGEDPSRAAKMSYTIRRSQERGIPAISPGNLDSYWQVQLPKPPEQLDDLILWIGDHQTDGATEARAAELLLDAWIGSGLPDVVGNAKGLRWLIPKAEARYFDHRYEHGYAAFHLTLEGWERYAALKQKKNDSRTAFMAMKFDDEMENVFKTCFRPAVARTDFELRVVTDQQPAGLIDNQIKAALVAARFVVADLSHDNLNAHWEAGFGEGRNIPVFYTCKEERWVQGPTAFNTNHMKTIRWSGDLKAAEDQLTYAIRATLRAEAKQDD